MIRSEAFARDCDGGDERTAGAPGAAHDAPHVLLPALSDFVDVVAVALHAAAAIADDGETSALPEDLDDVVEALHLPLEPRYGDPDREAITRLPGLEDLAMMVAQATRRTQPPPGWPSERDRLVAAYLHLLLAPPVGSAMDDAGRDRISRDELDAFVTGSPQPHSGDTRVAVSLLQDMVTRQRVRDVLELRQETRALDVWGVDAACGHHDGGGGAYRVRPDHRGGA